MISSSQPTRLGALVLASLSALPSVAAHGQIKGVLANGVYTDGPNIYWDADPVNEQTAIRKMYQAASPSYVLPQDFSDDSKMACETAAGAPQIVTVSAGSQMRIDWVGATGELENKPGTGNVPPGQYPWVHAMGTVASYISHCTNDDCSTTDPSQSSWIKLALFGIDKTETISNDLRETMQNKPEEYYPTAGTSGLWGMARFVEAGSSWTVTIPEGLTDGQYILRQELGAVHNPWNAQDDTSGTQLYIGCIQMQVTDGGTVELPEGTKAGSLYETDGAFARYNVYDDNGQSFVDPGPTIWTSPALKKREVHERWNHTSAGGDWEEYEAGSWFERRMMKVKRSVSHATGMKH
ncbi:glycosyl hydrolase family 61-domain-containing protein [Rhodocollybia butyracea]|uniref:Glycosyl hydrolase family 61-domain-containing protein n=1 Tax=Rhodocollybia butyracea TaxID=206335 RepID=A0A9P5PWS1_9AGAR|nr:glycosyl hydrolase family 61-domain-containing protein [Rhodocollybia butyracea]